MRGPTKRGVANLASPSNLVVMGRKLDRIHNYERQFAGRRQSGNSRRADRRGDQCTVCVAVASSAAMDSVRSEDPVNRQRQPDRGAGIRACGRSSAPVGPTLTMTGSPRTGRTHGLAGSALHTGNTFWKN